MPPLRLLPALLLLAAAARACDVQLALPASGGATPAAGLPGSWCPPFALDDFATQTCDKGITVPPGGVLEFGTCALPGAACSGATDLTLRDKASGAELLQVDRVPLNSSVAALSKGCVLGVRCSYGEWRSSALAPVGVSIREACHLATACAGVTAWRISAQPALLPALLPTTASALAFTATAAADTSLTKLGGVATAGTVTVYGVVGVFQASALAAPAGWTQLGAGALPLTLTAPLALAAGQTATLLVVASSADALPCAHALGTNLSSVLLSDDLLTLTQGGAVTGSPLAAGAALGAACAWSGLAVTYSTPAACAPPAPPPLPDIATVAPDALVRSLADLVRALADYTVKNVEVISHIALNGTDLNVTLNPVTRQRALSVRGTFACEQADPLNPLCSLDAGGLSRVFAVTANVTLHLAHILLTNGAAPAGGFGGCVLADGAALTLDTVELRNCSAPAGGGGVAVLDGGSLASKDTLFDGCASMVGGGMLVSHGTAAVNTTTFHHNIARGSSTAVSVSLGSLPGPVGGGLALYDVTGNVSRSTFDYNSASTDDIVLLPNPDAGQARGGGLFIGLSAINVSSSTFHENEAFFGGGVNINNSTVLIDASILIENFATIGFGGGLFARNCQGDGKLVSVSHTLVALNMAGGRMGGGMGAINSALTVASSNLVGNSAPNGCGGALGLDAASVLHLTSNSTVSNSTAQSGGALCCNMCTGLFASDSTLYDNTAMSGTGGAIKSDASPTSLLNVTLSGNVAPQGGAISAVASPLNLTACALIGNAARATHGGAVSHDSAEDPTAWLLMSGTKLTNNTATAGGGALAAFQSGSVDLRLCDFENNTIAGPSPSGGAMLALDVAVVLMHNVTFGSNSLTVTPAVPVNASWGYSSVPTARSSGFGGALWLASNTPTSASIFGGVFKGNFAPKGGGVYATGAVTLDVEYTTFQMNDALDYSSVGGALVTEAGVAATLFHTLFEDNSAVRGGGAWHGGSSTAAYSACTFNSNHGVDGDDIKGNALHVTDASHVSVTGSLFSNNHGSEAADGAVVLSGEDLSYLSITETVFDGNVANLGACLFITAHSQVRQLSLSGLTFQNNYAQVAALIFTEAVEFERLDCPSAQCAASVNNSAHGGRKLIGTPPTTITVNMSASVRSGGQLPIALHLIDGFGQALKDWPDTTATLARSCEIVAGQSCDTDAQITGSERSFFADGAADFPGLTLKGLPDVPYALMFTITGPELFGSGMDSMSTSQNISVQACGSSETFDAASLGCKCATGYGIVVETHECELCTDNQVVPLDALVASCATCPPLSKPLTGHECVCNAGYFGALVGATGVCTQCPMNTYRSEADPPESCLPCPNTSQTFSLGTTTSAGCMCGSGSFTDLRGSTNGSFTCSKVPDGGWSPQGDPRLFALADFWRPSQNVSDFWKCTAGNCLQEVPIPNTTQTGYHCRTGHTGHVCAVCEHGWAYQGVFCSPCEAGASFSEWNMGKKVTLLMFGLALLLAAIFVLFFLPLFPGIEESITRMLKPAADRVGAAMDMMVPRRSRPSAARLSGGSRVSGARTSGRISGLVDHTGGALVSADGHLHVVPAGRPTSPLRPGSAGKRPQSNRIGGKDAPTPQAKNTARGKRKLQALLDVVGEPLRIIVSFWQVVSSFNNTLAVPWPSVYYSLASALSVVSLQLLRLPNIACIQPEVSFYIVFDGITITMLIFISFCGLTYYFGSRSAVAKADPERKRRFKTRVINNFIWGIFLVYPQVSATTLLIFSCIKLEDGTEWMSADLREQCWTPKHKVHVGAGVVWTLLYPAGIPCALLYALYKAGVPELAVWKRDCAWLRAIVQRALVLKVKLPDLVDADTLTTECITIEQLRILHDLFIVPDDADAEKKKEAAQSRALVVHSMESPQSPESPTAVSPGALSRPGASRTTSVRMPALAAAHLPEHPLMPDDTRLARARARAVLWLKIAGVWLLTTLRQLRMHGARLARASTKAAKNKLTGMLWSTERELMLGALLSWAQFDENSMVSEPRDNQLRWRSGQEWEALRAEGARLGERDVREQRAFSYLAFIFASYSCRAFYWESVDLLQKLFLTSVLTFVAPRSSVQIIVACLFAFMMLLFTLQIKPYRSASGNQLAALSQINIFLFLFCGLLLNTDPEGIANEKVLFSVLVGGLTTSIVGWSMVIFIRELGKQLVRALYGYEDEDEDDDWDEEQDGNGAEQQHLQEVLEDENEGTDASRHPSGGAPASALGIAAADGEPSRGEALVQAAAAHDSVTPQKEPQGAPGDSSWR